MANIKRSLASAGGWRSPAGIALGLAAAAGAAAAINVGLAYRAERRNPPAGRFVEVGGTRIHYLEKGSGPPLVLLHGNIVTADDFSRSGLLDAAAAHYRVVAFDRPGMGYSERPRGRTWTPAAQADLLRQAFGALGMERPVVLGHSLGAVVAMAMGLHFPAALRGLVLLGGYFYPTRRADALLAMPPAIPVLGDALCYTLSPPTGAALMPGFVKGMFSPRPVPRSFSEGFSPGMALRPWQLRAMAEDGRMMIPAAAAMQRRYGGLRVPLAIMAGAEDKVADVGRQSRRLHQAVPHSTLRLVPGAGHMVHYDVPGEVLAMVDLVSKDAGPSGMWP